DIGQGDRAVEVEDCAAEPAAGSRHANGPTEEPGGVAALGHVAGDGRVPNHDGAALVEHRPAQPRSAPAIARPAVRLAPRPARTRGCACGTAGPAAAPEPASSAAGRSPVGRTTVAGPVSRTGETGAAAGSAPGVRPADRLVPGQGAAEDRERPLVVDRAAQ